MNNDRFKFKIWDIDNNKWNGEDPEMDLIRSLQCNAFMYDNDNFDTPKNFKIVQSPGLKDKNGKLIFEGDIVKDGMEDLYCVEWGYAGKDHDAYAACFILMPINHDGDIAQLSFNQALESEVIGDIDTTPELLSSNQKSE